MIVKANNPRTLRNLIDARDVRTGIFRDRSLRPEDMAKVLEEYGIDTSGNVVSKFMKRYM
jgi:precorrin-6B methylase 1